MNVAGWVAVVGVLLGPLGGCGDSGPSDAPGGGAEGGGGSTENAMVGGGGAGAGAEGGAGGAADEGGGGAEEQGGGGATEGGGGEGGQGCEPTIEVCDGEDNTCEGAVDEGLGVGGAPFTPTPALGIPRIASSGSEFALVFNSAFGIVLERRTLSGTSLGLFPVDAGSGDGAAAWNGSEWGVTWRVGSEVYFRRFSAAGVALGGAPVELESSNLVSAPSLVADGSEWVVATTRRVVRVSPAGLVTDAAVLVAVNPHIAAVGSGFLVADEAHLTLVTSSLTTTPGDNLGDFNAAAVVAAPGGAWVAGTTSLGALVVEVDGVGSATGVEFLVPGGTYPALAPGALFTSGRLYRLDGALEEVSSFDVLDAGVSSLAASPSSLMMISGAQGHVSGLLGCNGP